MTTKYNADDIKASAERLGQLLSDMGAFEDLKPNWPNAGHFDLAQWLERIVDDRRNAIVAHAEHLKTACQDMQTFLTTIATKFDNVDGDNATQIKSAISDMEQRIGQDILQLDQGTEKNQNNFSDKPDAKNNNSDGDGYNDNLNTGDFGNTPDKPNASSQPPKSTGETPPPPPSSPPPSSPPPSSPPPSSPPPPPPPSGGNTDNSPPKPKDGSPFSTG